MLAAAAPRPVKSVGQSVPAEWKVNRSQRPAIKPPDVELLLAFGREFQPKAAFHKAVDAVPLPLFEFAQPVHVDEQVMVDRALDMLVRRMEPPARRQPGTVGRPPVIGKKQANLAARLVNPKTRWRRLRVTGWYGQGERLVEIVSGTALWHHPGRLVPIRYVLVRDVEGELLPQAFLCTDLDADPLDILRWFVRRWSIEVTFAEVRRHLGVETQRQWSDPAIARTTPALLGLFSLIALWANDLYGRTTPPPRAASWYQKPLPTFSDALALVRRELWANHDFPTSALTTETVQIPRRRSKP